MDQKLYTIFTSLQSSFHLPLEPLANTLSQHHFNEQRVMVNAHRMVLALTQAAKMAKIVAHCHVTLTTKPLNCLFAALLQCAVNAELLLLFSFFFLRQTTTSSGESLSTPTLFSKNVEKSE